MFIKITNLNFYANVSELKAQTSPLLCDNILFCTIITQKCTTFHFITKPNRSFYTYYKKTQVPLDWNRRVSFLMPNN